MKLIHKKVEYTKAILVTKIDKKITHKDLIIDLCIVTAEAINDVMNPFKRVLHSHLMILPPLKK